MLTTENTMNLKKATLSQVLPFYDSNMEYLEEQVPPYLNTACIPFIQQYYSLDSFDNLRLQYAGGKVKYEYDAYISALRDDEERKYLIKFAQKLIQWRLADIRNRTGLVMRRPVYGENCRRAVKVNLLF